MKTYHPKKLRHKRKHGFLSRSGKSAGRLVLKRRRHKGRHKLIV